MYFNKEKLSTMFSRKDFSRGQDYYKRGQVQKLRVSQTDQGPKVTCCVQGNISYNVSLFIEEKSVAISCDCPRFKEKRICKHIAAAMLACADLREDDIPTDSDRWAKSMLQSYMEKSARQTQQTPDQLAHLVPRICFGQYSGVYPSFSFQVGFDRLYVVRDIKKFAESVIRQETVSYGKCLKFCHALERFDPDSQKIITILTDQFTMGRTMRHYGSFYSDNDSALFPNYQKNQIMLTGNAFDRMFDLLQDKQIESSTKQKKYTFSVRDPETGLFLEQRGRAVELQLNAEGEAWEFFGNHQSLYAARREEHDAVPQRPAHFLQLCAAGDSGYCND